MKISARSVESNFEVNSMIENEKCCRKVEKAVIFYSIVHPKQGAIAAQGRRLINQVSYKCIQGASKKYILWRHMIDTSWH